MEQSRNAAYGVDGGSRPMPIVPSGSADITSDTDVDGTGNPSIAAINTNKGKKTRLEPSKMPGRKTNAMEGLSFHASFTVISPWTELLPHSSRVVMNFIIGHYNARRGKVRVRFKFGEHYSSEATPFIRPSHYIPSMLTYAIKNKGASHAEQMHNKTDGSKTYEMDADRQLAGQILYTPFTNNSQNDRAGNPMLRRWYDMPNQMRVNDSFDQSLSLHNIERVNLSEDIDASNAELEMFNLNNSTADAERLKFGVEGSSGQSKERDGVVVSQNKYLVANTGQKVELESNKSHGMVTSTNTTAQNKEKQQNIMERERSIINMGVTLKEAVDKCRLPYGSYLNSDNNPKLVNGQLIQHLSGSDKKERQYPEGSDTTEILSGGPNTSTDGEEFTDDYTIQKKQSNTSGKSLYNSSQNNRSESANTQVNSNEQVNKTRGTSVFSPDNPFFILYGNSLRDPSKLFHAKKQITNYSSSLETFNHIIANPEYPTLSDDDRFPYFITPIPFYLNSNTIEDKLPKPNSMSPIRNLDNTEASTSKFQDAAEQIRYDEKFRYKPLSITPILVDENPRFVFSPFLQEDNMFMAANAVFKLLSRLSGKNSPRTNEQREMNTASVNCMKSPKDLDQELESLELLQYVNNATSRVSENVGQNSKFIDINSNNKTNISVNTENKVNKNRNIKGTVQPYVMPVPSKKPPLEDGISIGHGNNNNNNPVDDISIEISSKAKLENHKIQFTGDVLFPGSQFSRQHREMLRDSKWSYHSMSLTPISVESFKHCYSKIYNNSELLKRNIYDKYSRKPGMSDNHIPLIKFRKIRIREITAFCRPIAANQRVVEDPVLQNVRTVEVVEGYDLEFIKAYVEIPIDRRVLHQISNKYIDGVYECETTNKYYYTKEELNSPDCLLHNFKRIPYVREKYISQIKVYQDNMRFYMNRIRTSDNKKYYTMWVKPKLYSLAMCNEATSYDKEWYKCIQEYISTIERFIYTINTIADGKFSEKTPNEIFIPIISRQFLEFGVK